MPLPQPTTLSPGHLVIGYVNSFSERHTASARFRAGVDITDVSLRRADAIELGIALSECVASNVTFTDWAVKDNDNNTLYGDLFDPAIPGGRPGSPATPWASQTITLTGHGNPSDVGLAHGQTRMVLYVCGAVPMAQRQKYFDVPGDTAFTNLAIRLTDPDTNYWADYFGSPASVNAQAPVQFNAHAQRELGA